MSDRDLTGEERIICAYLSVVCDIQHQHLAVAYDVNMGRVSEAVHAIRLAAADPKGIRAALEPRRLPEDQP
jgi:hypothetical protein